MYMCVCILSILFMSSLYKCGTENMLISNVNEDNFEDVLYSYRNKHLEIQSNRNFRNNKIKN